MGAGLAFLAGAAQGFEEWTDQERKFEMEEIRDIRRNEFKKSAAALKRSQELADREDERTYEAGLLTKANEREDAQRKEDHKNAMERVREQNKYKKYKKVTDKSYDEYGTKTGETDRYVNLDNYQFKTGPQQSSSKAYSTLDQIRSDLKAGKIDKVEARRRAAELGFGGKR